MRELDESEIRETLVRALQTEHAPKLVFALAAGVTRLAVTLVETGSDRTATSGDTADYLTRVTRIVGGLMKVGESISDMPSSRAEAIIDELMTADADDAVAVRWAAQYALAISGSTCGACRHWQPVDQLICGECGLSTSHDLASARENLSNADPHAGQTLAQMMGEAGRAFREAVSDVQHENVIVLSWSSEASTTTRPLFKGPSFTDRALTAFVLDRATRRFATIFHALGDPWVQWVELGEDENALAESYLDRFDSGIRNAGERG